MSSKEDKEIKDAIALAKKKQDEFFQEESEKRMKEFLEERNRVLGLDEEVIKKPSKRIQLKKPIIVCNDSDEEERPITNQEPIINCSVDIPEAIVDETPKPDEIPKPLIIPVFELASHRPSIEPVIRAEPVIKSILQESREEIPKTEQKLISVKKAPYDLKPSNEKLKIEELNKTIYDMKQKYDNLMKKHIEIGKENKELKKTIEEHKKYKAFYDLANNKKNSVKDWIEEAYKITNNYERYIKCCNLFEEYRNSDFYNQSISQIAFYKKIELLGVLKSKKTGYNCFYGLEEK
jgi:hypothetical protein